MRSRIQLLREKIFTLHPESALEPLSIDALSQLRAEYPSLPEHLADLFQIIGCGNTGEMGLMIHRLSKPDSIYDPLTASQLAGIRIVGDDFAGWCVGYDTENNWVFGGIEFGEFTPVPGYQTVLDLIEDWFINEKGT